MKKLFVLFLFLVLGTSIIVNAQLTSKIPISSDVKIGVLPNGLKYYIKYNAKPEKKIELRLAVNAGSILEDDSQQGLAHFMEHMNFNGLKHFPENQLIHYLQSIGVAFGNDLNAYTGFDQTVYMLPVPTANKDDVDKAFSVIADWAYGALLTDEEIDKERGVILSESRLGKGADDRMMKVWLPKMLNGSKYGVRLPIGLDDVVENFKYDELKRFYKEWYRPDLQAVIVVGDMSVEEVEKLITEKFSAHKMPEKYRQRPETFEIKPFEKSEAILVSDPEASMTSISIIGSVRPDSHSITEQDYLEDVINNLAYNMIYARFSEKTKEANPPFLYAYAYDGSWARGYKSFTTSAACSPENIEQATKTLVDVCMSVKKFGLTEQELERAKAIVLNQYEKQFNERDKTESGRLVNEYINNYLDHEPIPGIEWEYNFVKNHLKDIKLSDFDQVRKNINIDENYFCYVTTKTSDKNPSNESIKKWIDEAMKSDIAQYSEKQIATKLLKSEPKKGKIIKTEKNEKLGTTTYTLSNGAIVCLKPTNFKNDEILFRASKQGGYSTYTAKDYQSGMFANDVVEEMGYGNFSAVDLRKYLSGKNVSVMPSIDDYSEYISGNCGVKDIETMFQLLYLKTTSPRVDNDAYKSFVTRMKQQMTQAKSDPENLFFDTLYNTLYQNNPRAHRILNTSEIDKINIKNAISFYNERIGNPRNMYYTFVGSFSEEQIKPLIEKYIGGMNPGKSKAQYKDMGFRTQNGDNTFVLKKGIEPKAMLVQYFTKAVEYSYDEAFVLSKLADVINNFVLDTIREKMGLIYGGGFYGSLQKYPEQKLFMQSYFPCSPEGIETVRVAFLRLIELTKKDGFITENEWTRVKMPAAESYRVNIKVNNYWLNSLQNAYRLGFNPESILTFEERLNAITPEKLTKIANKYLTNTNVLTGKWLPEK